MTEFNPPISTRETEELIAIANGTLSNWQQLAIDLAKYELIKRGISNDYQQEILAKWEEDARKLETQLEIEYQNQRILNEVESYTTIKMIYIFFAAPFILVGKWTVDLSLIELRKENYQKKIKQRLFLLIGGITFWFFFVAYTAHIIKNNRQMEIDNASRQ